MACGYGETLHGEPRLWLFLWAWLWSRTDALNSLSGVLVSYYTQTIAVLTSSTSIEHQNLINQELYIEYLSIIF